MLLIGSTARQRASKRAERAQKHKGPRTSQGGNWVKVWHRHDAQVFNRPVKQRVVGPIHLKNGLVQVLQGLTNDVRLQAPRGAEGVAERLAHDAEDGARGRGDPGEVREGHGPEVGLVDTGEVGGLRRQCLGAEAAGQRPSFLGRLGLGSGVGDSGPIGVVKGEPLEIVQRLPRTVLDDRRRVVQQVYIVFDGLDPPPWCAHEAHVVRVREEIPIVHLRCRGDSEL
mmetsp:Transcript_168047/g.539614  ORF Transcript_168047/g.539614 Transcript_168047/m.539614 type:complete len:226 (-) Transcript_168047:1117-1794(-)